MFSRKLIISDIASVFQIKTSGLTVFCQSPYALALPQFSLKSLIVIASSACTEGTECEAIPITQLFTAIARKNCH